MVHQWRDVGGGKMLRTQDVQISDQYKPLIGVKEARLNGMGGFCDGDACGPAPSGTYIIHQAPCMMLRNSRTAEENEAYQGTEECG
jgi:hypothetical protein